MRLNKTRNEQLPSERRLPDDCSFLFFYVGFVTSVTITLYTENRKEVNKVLPNYSQITAIEVVEKEFEKTPKRSIKRFLYS